MNALRLHLGRHCLAECFPVDRHVLVHEEGGKVGGIAREDVV